jgi:FAD/FMN-containing dehydrogenase
MNKIAHYLQEHISGEIVTSNDARRHFSTDASIFKITPNVVIYPRNENDLRKITRFTWQLAERGRIFPITARGSGTDQSGAAIGSGIVIIFPTHMNKILELDGKNGTVVVEPGINYGKLQQTLFTHDRFLPPAPASMEYSTVGGALANNAGGDRSLKYGATLDYVKKLRVVLANGDVIETERLSKRDLNKKLGLNTFEGEIYRTIDTMIEDNKDLVDKLNLATTKNASGYNLNLVKHKDGSVDLSPLFIGSQGTLGLITEASLTTLQRRATSTLVAAMIEDVRDLQDVVIEARKYSDSPSAMELVDENLLDLVYKNDPNLIKGVVSQPLPKFILLVEFDDSNDHTQKKLARKLTKFLKDKGITYHIETDNDKKEELWKIRHSTTAIIAHNEGGAKPLPIIEDGIVPPEHIGEFITEIYKMYEKYHLKATIYGHAGDGHLHLQPILDLKQVGDRQKIFKLMEEYYNLVISMSGSISGENGDGRLRAPFLKMQYHPELFELFVKVKTLFDPFNTLNPGVKFGGNLESLKPLLREEYSLGHLSSYLPHI